MLFLSTFNVNLFAIILKCKAEHLHGTAQAKQIMTLCIYTDTKKSNERGEFNFAVWWQLLRNMSNTQQPNKAAAHSRQQDFSFITSTWACCTHCLISLIRSKRMPACEDKTLWWTKSLMKYSWLQHSILRLPQKRVGCSVAKEGLVRGARTYDDRLLARGRNAHQRLLASTFAPKL